MKKKIVSLTLTCILILSTFATTFAENVYSEMKTILESSDWHTSSGVAETVFDKTGEYPNISFNWGSGDYDQQMFEFELPVDGKYAISIRSSQSTVGYISRTSLYVEADGEEKRISEISMPATDGQFLFTQLGICDLEAGTVKIKLEMTFGDIILNAVKIELLTAPTISEVKAGDLQISENDTIKRGTDSFTLTFSGALKELDENAKIAVMEGNKEISSVAELDGNTININLKQTLSYETDYVITAVNLKDVNDVFTVNKIEFPFSTGGTEADGAMSFTTDLVADAVYNHITLTGKVIGSKNQGIAGRRVDIFLKDKDGVLSENPVSSVVSGEDGMFKAEIVIEENSPSGAYALATTCEYQPGPIDAEFDYVSRAREAEILSELSKVSDSSGAEEFITTYQQELMVDTATDLVGIRDTSRFYGCFVGESYENGDAFREFYYTHAALEKINQAQTENDVISVLQDSVACGLLDINEENMTFITGGYEGFAADVLALPEYTEKNEMSDAVNSLINKWIKAEYVIFDSVTTATDITVTHGQEIIIPLDFEAEVTSVDKIVYTFDFSDASYVESEKADFDINGSANISRNGNTISIEFLPQRPLGGVKTIGNASLVAAKEGAFTIKIGGELNYIVKAEINGAEKTANAKAVITEKTVSAQILPKTQNSKPSRVETTPSGGGGTSSRPTIPVPPVEVTPTEAPSDDGNTGSEKFEFKDIENFEWARESIYGLLELGVIAKSEDGLFNPSANIKREELVKMIVVALRLYDENAQCDFADVPKDSWYYPYVAAAYEAGVTEGIGDNLFGSGMAVSRQELATLIYRVSKLEAEGAETNLFEDDDEISDWARTAVYELCARDIISGMGDNMFEPELSATRAMAAKIIYAIVREAQK